MSGIYIVPVTRWKIKSLLVGDLPCSFFIPYVRLLHLDIKTYHCIELKVQVCGIIFTIYFLISTFNFLSLRAYVDIV